MSLWVNLWSPLPPPCNIRHAKACCILNLFSPLTAEAGGLLLPASLSCHIVITLRAVECMSSSVNDSTAPGLCCAACMCCNRLILTSHSLTPHFHLNNVIVYNVPPKDAPPSEYFCSSVNNVFPQWILSPLEQGFRTVTCGNSVTSRWEDEFVLSNLEWPHMQYRAGKEAWKVSVSSAASMNDKHWSRRPAGYKAKCISS